MSYYNSSRIRLLEKGKKWSIVQLIMLLWKIEVNFDRISKDDAYYLNNWF